MDSVVERDWRAAIMVAEGAADEREDLNVGWLRDCGWKGEKSSSYLWVSSFASSCSTACMFLAGKMECLDGAVNRGVPGLEFLVESDLVGLRMIVSPLWSVNSKLCPVTATSVCPSFILVSTFVFSLMAVGASSVARQDRAIATSKSHLAISISTHKSGLL